MRVVDLCVRPPFGDALTSSLYRNIGTFGKGSRRQRPPPPASAVQGSMDMFVAELEAQSAIAMVMMRRGGGSVEDCDNGEITKIRQMHPGVFEGLVGIDALGGTTTLDEIVRFVKSGPGIGVVMEPAHTYTPESAHFDDPRIFPIYDFCQAEGIPAVLNWGGVQNFQSFAHFDPGHIDTVARTFPQLKLVLHHAGWPYVREACLLAMRHPNLYLSPSPCIRREFIGSDDYVQAANQGVITHQLLFSSCYPLHGIAQAVQACEQRGFNDAALECFLSRNAIELFEIS